MELLCETPRAWVDLAVDRFDEVLVDHAHCEKKAAAHALSLLAAFPHVPGLARAMASPRARGGRTPRAGCSR